MLYESFGGSAAYLDDLSFRLEPIQQACVGIFGIAGQGLLSLQWRSHKIGTKDRIGELP